VPDATLAVIGGSGFYQMEGLESVERRTIGTPYGDPSDTITIGTLAGRRVAFLPRHGAGHRILPGELPQRANIYALKLLGVERIIAISAVGSLREEIRPLDLVIPDQLIDRTKNRPSSFFGEGLVAHIAFAEPFCPQMRALLGECAHASGATTHAGGTYVVMEGPAFSTRAESELYRSWGASLIGMTALPEAKLAREAEICYAAVACATDYDCWHETEESVSADLILNNLLRNVEVSKQIVRLATERLPAERACACGDALAGALITAPEHVPPATRERLWPLIGRYVAPGRSAGDAAASHLHPAQNDSQQPHPFPFEAEGPPQEEKGAGG
jgi:5'-methylthioadenosine phosphorylase